MDISIRHDMDKALRQLSMLDLKQRPFAVATALTDIANEVREAHIRAMPSEIDRPKPFTINSLYVKRARKDDLVSRVFFKERIAKGTTADKYLRPIVYSGARPQKRYEVKLSADGALPVGMKSMPGRGAPMDAYGNIRGSEVAAIIAQLGVSNGGDGPQRKRGYISDKKFKSLQKRGLVLSKGTGAQRTVVRSQYFVAHSKKTGDPLGVWKLVSRGHVEPVLIFARQANYKESFHFIARGERVVRQRFGAVLGDAIRYAIETAYVTEAPRR
jgi:hypothetical protein